MKVDSSTLVYRKGCEDCAKRRCIFHGKQAIKEHQDIVSDKWFGCNQQPLYSMSGPNLIRWGS